MIDGVSVKMAASMEGNFLPISGLPDELQQPGIVDNYAYAGIIIAKSLL